MFREKVMDTSRVSSLIEPKCAVIRVALIGVSGYARVHYEMLAAAAAKGQIRLVAVTVINSEEEAERCRSIRDGGGVIFEDAFQMLDELSGRIDLCFIPTGIHLHAAMTIAALEAGANVYVEKPAAATIQDVRAMQEAEARCRRFVAVGYQTIYAEETLWMKDLILGGKIGHLKSIKCRGLWPRMDAYYVRNGWAGRLRVNGDWILDSPINNAISHQLNMLCFLAGGTREQSAEIAEVQAELYRARDIESADTACLRIRTGVGVPMYFFVTHSCEGHLNPEIVVRGDAGEICWTFDSVTLRTADGEVETRPSESAPDVRKGLMARLIERMRNPDVFICGLEVAAAQTLCVNAAHESSPINVIPSRWVNRYPSEGDVKTVVSGLDEAIGAGFQSERLFSEMDIAWAQAGQMICLDSDYVKFPTYRSFEPKGDWLND
jgi:predicted dehydrogenase